MKMIIIIAILVAVTGCGSLSEKELNQYHDWKESGKLVKVKSPGGAFALGLLPGGGSFYVGRIGMGVIDLLLWTPSLLWDAPASYIAAQRINYDATLAATTTEK